MGKRVFVGTRLHVCFRKESARIEGASKSISIPYEEVDNLIACLQKYKVERNEAIQMEIDKLKELIDQS